MGQAVMICWSTLIGQGRAVLISSVLDRLFIVAGSTRSGLGTPCLLTLVHNLIKSICLFQGNGILTNANQKNHTLVGVTSFSVSRCQRILLKACFSSLPLCGIHIFHTSYYCAILQQPRFSTLNIQQRCPLPSTLTTHLFINSGQEVPWNPLALLLQQ